MSSNDSVHLFTFVYLFVPLGSYVYICKKMETNVKCNGHNARVRHPRIVTVTKCKQMYTNGNKWKQM